MTTRITTSKIRQVRNGSNSVVTTIPYFVAMLLDLNPKDKISWQVVLGENNTKIAIIKKEVQIENNH